LTTLFDLTAKLTVSNQSIFEKVTECLDHKLVDYFRKLYEDGDHMIGGFEKTKSLCTIRIYDVEGCKNITINLETPKEAFERYNTKFEDCFEAFLADELKKSVPNCMRANFIPAIKRCLKNVPYLRTSDNRIIEYKFEEVLFSKQSDFQLVQVVDTKDYGRMLILDGFANLAEIDTEDYTHSLMNLPHENYKGKEVLILGGGDGGLMNELLKLPKEKRPEFVTMVDIDEVVMEACAEHMPNVCGPYLQKNYWNGPNYRIIAGCAIQFMKDCQKQGKKFDYIFGDLTDTPVSTHPRDDDKWIFLSTILELAVSILVPQKGKYFTHCIGINSPVGIQAYEEILSKIGEGKCIFNKFEHYVKSFVETWMFYQISKKL